MNPGAFVVLRYDVAMTRVVLVAVLTSTLVGCGETTRVEDASVDSGLVDAALDAARDVGPPDVGPQDVGAPDTYDPFCHWDCFGGLECEDGVVYEHEAAPVPCDEWTGRCPRYAVGTCPDGCGDRRPSGSADWERYCEGMEERLAGDPCASDDDCHPPAPSGAMRRYLACDVDAGACVAIDPPTHPVVACGDVDLDALSTPEGSAYGVVRDESCAGGWCRFVAQEAPACDPQACAMPCEDDWDCPPSHFCRAQRDWTGRTLEDRGEDEYVAVCEDFGGGLACP